MGYRGASEVSSFTEAGGCLITHCGSALVIRFDTNGEATAFGDTRRQPQASLGLL